MKVTLLTAVNSRNAGGLFYSVKYLARYLGKIPVDVSITSFNDEFSSEDISTYNETPMNIYDVSENKLLKKLGYSKNIHKILDTLSPDVIHQQGIWMYHSAANNKYQSKNSAAKSVIAPRGMLDPWLRQNSPVIKKIVGLWYENANLKKADCLHALCISEMESMRKFGLTNPIAVIPNGIELVDWQRPEVVNKSEKTMLYLGRLDAKKGVEIFLSALSVLKNSNPEILSSWKFIIAGWGDPKYIAQLKSIVEEAKMNDKVVFKGPQYGEDKVNLLKEADAFVLPSHSEGLPMAILEAWAYQLPVVMTEYCNIPEGFEYNAAYEISTSLEKMQQQLAGFLQLSDTEVLEFGKKGRKLVEEKFVWNKIASQTHKMYTWLLSGGEKPDFIHL